MKIYYDNYCPNCTRFIQWVKRLDWLHLITICQLRSASHMEEAIGIDQELAKKQMASFYKKWYYGFNTLFQIFYRLPLFWGLLPFFFVMKITGIGQFFYMKLAIHRKIIPLHCDNNSCSIPIEKNDIYGKK